MADFNLVYNTEAGGEGERQDVEIDQKSTVCLFKHAQCKTYLQISFDRNFCSSSLKSSGPVKVAFPGSVMAEMDSKTDCSTVSVQPGCSQSSTRKATTAYCLAVERVSVCSEMNI